MKPDNRKDEILQTAARLFKEKGYASVSMRDLAKDLGIQAASLYNHIKSKQEILSTIVMAAAEAFTNGMDEIVHSQNSPLEKLEAVIDMHVQITIDYADNLGSLNSDWMHLKEPNLSSFLKMRTDYEENFRNILKEGVAKGEIVNLPVEPMLFSILSTLRTLYLWYARTEGVEAQQLSQQMKQILLKGIVR